MLASESVTIHAYYIAETSEQKALFARAVALAEAAVQSDPQSAAAWLQAARATGRYAQTLDTMEALEGGYGKKLRETIAMALQLDPDMAAGHLMMGMWHSEIVAAIGGFMGGMLYGADEDEGIAHLERALAGAPDEKAAALQGALGLLNFDARDHRDRARELLLRAIALPTRHALDALIHAAAVERLAALDD